MAVRRLDIGGSVAEYRRFPKSRHLELEPGSTKVYVIVPIAGRVGVGGAEAESEAGPGDALLLGRIGRIACRWLPDSAALIIGLRRARLQALASASIGMPCRLAGHVTTLTGVSEIGSIAQILAAMAAAATLTPSEGNALEFCVARDLVAALCAGSGDPAPFTPARSVGRAVDHIRADPIAPLSHAALAGVAGVTLGTLRRNFKQCLGLSISAFAHQARLEWVRERLGNAHECGSIRQLSDRAGFSTPSMLARAYQRSFGETPSRTRARIFGAAQQ